MNKKHLQVNISLLLFSTVLSLLILELSYSIFVFGSDSFSIEKMNSFNKMEVSGLLKSSTHSEVIYELKPNLMVS